MGRGPHTVAYGQAHSMFAWKEARHIHDCNLHCFAMSPIACTTAPPCPGQCVFCAACRVASLLGPCWGRQYRSIEIVGLVVCEMYTMCVFIFVLAVTCRSCDGQWLYRSTSAISLVLDALPLSTVCVLMYLTSPMNSCGFGDTGLLHAQAGQMPGPYCAGEQLSPPPSLCT